MTVYTNPGDGDVIQPVMEGYRMACCDCGLVHELDFNVTDDMLVQFRAWRNERATAAKRREMRKRGELP